MKPELQILGWALTAAVTLLGFVLTRRSATDTTGASLLVAAAERQAKDIEALRADLTDVKSRARALQRWAIQAYDAMRGSGMTVDPPPPLD